MDDNIFFINGLTIKEGYNDQIIVESEKYYKKITFDISNDTKGSMICYSICPGVSLVFNEFNVMNDTFLFITQNNDSDIISIDYCKEGPYQCELSTVDRIIAIGENDVHVTFKAFKERGPDFLKGYHSGCSLLINHLDFMKFIDKYYPVYNSKIDNYYNEMLSHGKFVLFNAKNEILEVVTNLYETKINDPMYYKLKSFELLLLIINNMYEDERKFRNTYTDSQVRVVKKIRYDLSRDIANYVSLDILSKRYAINLTTLKNCFRDLYGKPLYAWYKEYKFIRAKDLIKNTNYTIEKIADMVGYKTSSKFSKAFKKEMGYLPSSLRKK